MLRPPLFCASIYLTATAFAQDSATSAGPQVLDVQGGKIRVTQIVGGLFHPFSLAMLPDGAMLIAEKNGRLRMVREGALLPEPVWTSPARTAQPNDSLHFVAVHPRFADNKWIYVSYPKLDTAKGSTLAIARGKLNGTKLENVQEIFVADAWETGGNWAGRIFFGPDASLYVAVGDRDRICCNGSEDNSLRMKAQALDSDAGKSLRLRDDGTPHPENPFIGRAGAKPEIFTYGHRNGYGFTIHPETGQVWQTEIGPMGGDEVNILSPGHNYGWPLVSMGRNYTGSLVSEEPWARKGMDNPRMFWVPSISPSSLMFYTGDKFPQWKNNLFVGSLTQKQLLRISFNQPSQAEKREGLLIPLNQRIRDIQQGADGFLYVATERASGGTTADGTILRIEPAQ